MIPIRRLASPAVLQENRQKWTAAFLEKRAKDSNARPSSKQYAHPDIVSTLETMGHCKCFYCEQSTKQTKAEVDHYIEVADKPALAFEWENLYRACWDCNHKKTPNSSIAAAKCLDPCDPEVRPSEHLAFESEIIRAKSNSSVGLKTIQKYKLDRPDLDYKRLKQLQRFDLVLLDIRNRQVSESRQTMTESEKGLLGRFLQADYPFSLMFSYYLSGLGMDDSIDRPEE